MLDHGSALATAEVELWFFKDVEDDMISLTGSIRLCSCGGGNEGVGEVAGGREETAAEVEAETAETTTATEGEEDEGADLVSTSTEPGLDSPPERDDESPLEVFNVD